MTRDKRVKLDTLRRAGVSVAAFFILRLDTYVQVCWYNENYMKRYGLTV